MEEALKGVFPQMYIHHFVTFCDISMSPIKKQKGGVPKTYARVCLCVFYTSKQRDIQCLFYINGLEPYTFWQKI